MPPRSTSRKGNRRASSSTRPAPDKKRGTFSSKKEEGSFKSRPKRSDTSSKPFEKGFVKRKNSSARPERDQRDADKFAAPRAGKYNSNGRKKERVDSKRKEGPLEPRPKRSDTSSKPLDKGLIKRRTSSFNPEKNFGEEDRTQRPDRPGKYRSARQTGRSKEAPEGTQFSSKSGKGSGTSPGSGEKGESGFFKKGYKKKRASSRSMRPLTEEEPSPADATIRLNKYISNSGICSRREADNLITMGLVSVNGQVVTELGYKVKPGEVVRYEDKVLKAEKPVYILLNKPKGYLTTTKDPQERNTVMELIGSAVKQRVYPVGRLDRNTTGLLLLTNDGDLADKLSHPSFNVKKIYKVELDKPLTKADFQKIHEGVRLAEGRAIVDDLAMVGDDGKTVGIELHIGWNRVVRRIFESAGYTVVKLDRVVYAGLDKKDLPRGHWRFLTKGEVVKLKHFQ